MRAIKAKIIIPSYTASVKNTPRLQARLNAIVAAPGDVSVYDGPLMVTPHAHEPVVLETENKIVMQNISVLQVPCFETSNEYGTTVYIASESENEV